MTNSFKEELINITNKEIENKKQKELKLEKEKKDNIKKIAENIIKKFTEQDIKNQLLEKANNGEYTCDLSVFYFEKNIPDWFEIVVQHIKEIAKNLNVKAEESINTLEPFGSDPIFEYTTYSGIVTLSWNKK